jgi:hypothetical protein
MRTRVVRDDSGGGFCCVQRGPIVFVRDRRFVPGDLDEPVDIVCDEQGYVREAQLVRESLPEGVWMGLRIPVAQADGKRGSMMLVDFSSAGMTLDASSAYRIWLPAPRKQP